MTVLDQHHYISTACLHRECGSCRKTCKFCDSPCQHGCHTGGTAGPVAGVDQAREIARELYAHLCRVYDTQALDEVTQRVTGDPALFWLRGEEQPPGVHPG